MANWLSLTGQVSGEEVLIRVDEIKVVDNVKVQGGIPCAAVYTAAGATPVKQRLSAIRETLEALGETVTEVSNQSTGADLLAVRSELAAVNFGNGVHIG